MATVRRVRRVIRKVDPWTVFKVALLLHLVFAVAVLIGLLMFWSLLARAGVPASLDDFLIRISLLDEGSALFDNGGRFVRVSIFFAFTFGAAMTLLTTLAAILYNLVSDVVGGVEVVMLEESLRLPDPEAAPAPVSSPSAAPDFPTEIRHPLDPP